MLEFITITLFRIGYCVAGGYFISCALNDYEKRRYFLVGMNIMLAVWNAGWLIKTFA